MGLSISNRSGLPTSVGATFNKEGAEVLRFQGTGKITARVPQLARRAEPRLALIYFAGRFNLYFVRFVEPARGGPQSLALARRRGEEAAAVPAFRGHETDRALSRGGQIDRQVTHREAEAVDPPFRAQETARAWSPGGLRYVTTIALGETPREDEIKLKLRPSEPRATGPSSSVLVTAQVHAPPGARRDSVESLDTQIAPRAKDAAVERASVRSTSSSGSARSQVSFADEFGWPLAEILPDPAGEPTPGPRREAHHTPAHEARQGLRGVLSRAWAWLTRWAR